MTDTEIQTQPIPSVLVEATKHNDVVFIADVNHEDDKTHLAVKDRLSAMHEKGSNAIYIEQDPKETTKQEILGRSDAYGDMAREAERLGMRVVAFDDRTRQNERDARYPEEAKFVQDNDFYLKDQESLIKNFSNHDKMRDYIDEINKNKEEDLKFRNEKMVGNLHNDMSQHPNEKSIVVVGAAHLSGNNDVDEGLRKNGHQSITVEFNHAESNVNALQAVAADRPDLIKHDNFLSYKDPKTNVMKHADTMDEVPWHNAEPVSNIPDHIKALAKSATKGCEGVECTGDKQTAPAATPSTGVKQVQERTH